MKQFFYAILFLSALNAYAADEKANQWQSTKLSDATIEKVQKSKYKYMQCISAEMQKKEYKSIDTRAATDKIMKKCESGLAQIHKIFIQEKIPTNIADQYVKKTRIQTSRKVLEQMIFKKAALNMSQ